MEHKAIQVEIKADSSGIFEGYASVFGNVDSYGDIVQPGAFKKTILERSNQIKVLWNHDSYAPPIGKMLSAVEDGKGLYIKAQLAQTPRGQEIAELMRAGAIGEMSIGYSTLKYSYEQRDDLKMEVRNLLEVKLYEFSPVNFPANEAATITQIKREGEAETLALQLKHWLSDELKAGRTLSAASLERIKTALSELQTLLDGAEPSKSLTQPASVALEPIASLEPPVEDLFLGLKTLRNQTRSHLLIAELREFGAALRGG